MFNEDFLAALHMALEEGATVEVKVEKNQLMIIKKRESRKVAYKKELG